MVNFSEARIQAFGKELPGNVGLARAHGPYLKRKSGFPYSYSLNSLKGVI